MIPIIKRYCEMATAAIKDPSLIPNHKDGIVKPMQDELTELIKLKELLKNESDQKEFVEELTKDIATLEEALSVYAEPNSCVLCKNEETCGYSFLATQGERNKGSYDKCPLGLMSSTDKPFFEAKIDMTDNQTISKPIIISSLQKTTPSCPAQWDGWLEDGRAIYIHFRWGHLRIYLSETPTANIDEAVDGQEIFSKQLERMDGWLKTKELIELTKDILQFPSVTKGDKPPPRKRLARYKGKYWYLEDHKDHRGYVSLVDIKDSSAGCNAPPDKIREITGEEYDKQIKAIESLQVAHPEAFS